MARKSVPFKVYIHYTGKKTTAEIQEIYEIKNGLFLNNWLLTMSKELWKKVLQNLHRRIRLIMFPTEYSAFANMKSIRQHLLSHSVFFSVNLYPLPDIVGQ